MEIFFKTVLEKRHLIQQQETQFKA